MITPFVFASSRSRAFARLFRRSPRLRSASSRSRAFALYPNAELSQYEPARLVQFCIRVHGSLLSCTFYLPVDGVELVEFQVFVGLAEVFAAKKSPVS